MCSISSSARAWVGFASVTVSKLAWLPWTRLVLRTMSASSASRLVKEWQVAPSLVLWVDRSSFIPSSLFRHGPVAQLD